MVWSHSFAVVVEVSGATAAALEGCVGGLSSAVSTAVGRMSQSLAGTASMVASMNSMLEQAMLQGLQLGESTAATGHAHLPRPR